MPLTGSHYGSAAVRVRSVHEGTAGVDEEVDADNRVSAARNLNRIEVRRDKPLTTVVHRIVGIGAHPEIERHLTLHIQIRGLGNLDEIIDAVEFERLRHD